MSSSHWPILSPSSPLRGYYAAVEFDRGGDPRVAHGRAAMAKLFALEMVARVTDRALQIFG